MALSERDRRAIWIGAGLIGLGLLLRVVVMPVVAHWRELRSSAYEGAARVAAIEQKLNRRDALVDRQRARFGPGVDKPLQPVEQVQISFPQSVQKALGKGGLGVSSVEPQGVRKLREVPGVVLVSLRVRCGGGPDALPQALAAIQGYEQLIIVDSFNLTMTKPGERNQWSVNMLVSTPALEAGRP